MCASFRSGRPCVMVFPRSFCFTKVSGREAKPSDDLLERGGTIQNAMRRQRQEMDERSLKEICESRMTSGSGIVG